MKRLMYCCALLAVFFVSGCVVRSYTTERDRVDQEIHGNRGFIMGTPSAVEEPANVRKTRKIYNVEVEVPSLYRPSKEKKTGNKDKELYGNRGYLEGSMAPEKEVYVTKGGERQITSTRLSGGMMDSTKMPQVVYSDSPGYAGSEPMASDIGSEKQYYVVQNGDTLQKISEKFFGTTKKWKRIYNANKHVLKSPDRIRPGQKLVIPKE